MDWTKVITALRQDAQGIRDRAQMAFPHDHVTSGEMRSRAALLVSIADALQAGLNK